MTKLIAYSLCFVLSDDDFCLMLKRSRPPHQHRWNAPGGKLAAGEDPLVGCLRELKEETGLAPSVRASGTLDCIDRLQPAVIYRLYLFMARHRQVAIPASEEGRFQWLPLAQVLTDAEMVHNIPLFLPAMLSQEIIECRFEYAGQFLESYQINLTSGGKGLPI